MDERWEANFDWPTIRLPLELSPHIIHVVRLRLDLPAEQWQPLKRHLTADEIQRGDRFRFEEPRQRFVTCRATLRQLLGHACHVSPVDVPLQYGSHGKPCLPPLEPNSQKPPIQFSVSHSGDLGLIAIGVGADIGVDIEEFNPAVKAEQLANRFFSPAEAAELSKLPQEKLLSGFYRGWTCKEAYIKATGLGLSLSLSTFCVTIDPSQPASLWHVDDRPDEHHRWTTQSLDVAPNYAAAVMSARPKCQIQCWQWSNEVFSHDHVGTAHAQ